jgi:DNA-binding NtrC family response regulator
VHLEHSIFYEVTGYERTGRTQRVATIPINVLVVEDDEATRKLCADVAETCGMMPLLAASVEEALRRLENHPVDIVLTDLILPPSSGLDLLKQVHELYPQVAVLVLTQYGSIDSAVTATRMGAVDYVTKPFHVDDLRARLERVARDLDLDRENRLLREQLRSRPGFGGLIGVSAKMQSVYKMIEKVSQHDHPVLILGESGTGKELVAKSIHYSSNWKGRSFAPVDCSSLVATLIESELFGYVKGAFTGAMQSKQGLLEAAQGGTLFLDEIGDMPIDLQAKLLRALQEREVKPVGATERRQINVRVIAATNRDLDSAIRAGQFLSVVREHGGQVRVSNAAAGGAVFTIELPVAAEAATDSMVRSVPAFESVRPALPASIGQNSRPDLPPTQASRRGARVLRGRRAHRWAAHRRCSGGRRNGGGRSPRRA